MNGRLKHGFAREAETCLIVALAVSCVGGAALTERGEDDGPQPVETRKDPGDPRQELEELGTTLKAAVMSGTLTEKEAREIYGAAASRLWEELKASSDGKGAEAAEEAETADPKHSVLRLSAPKPEQIRVLLEPEFLRRDLPILREELDFDRTQMMIANVLFRDYLQAITLASSPLREALGRYHRAARDRQLGAALERSDERLEAAVNRAQRIDLEVAVERTQEELERIAREYQEKIESGGEESRAKFDAWTQRMVEVTGQLDARLASIRERVTAELAELDREDATISAQDLIRMATEFRAERAADRQFDFR